MFIGSIKRTNGLISKRVQYLLKSYYWKKLKSLKLWFSWFLKICLQLTQTSLNFKTPRCNLKVKGLGAKACVAFLLFWFWKELWRFKVDESILFVEQRYKLSYSKNKTELKMENPTHTFRDANLVLQVG